MTLKLGFEASVGVEWREGGQSGEKFSMSERLKEGNSKLGVGHDEWTSDCWCVVSAEMGQESGACAYELQDFSPLSCRLRLQAEAWWFLVRKQREQERDYTSWSPRCHLCSTLGSFFQSSRIQVQ